MLKRILGFTVLSAIVFCIVAMSPRTCFATAKSEIYRMGDNSVVYRRRHGADDGDADDMPGGAHAGEDDRDQDLEREANEAPHNEGLRGGAIPAGTKPLSGRERNDGAGKPKADPIGR